MKTSIYLVRHAESLLNIDPTFAGEDVLSENGIKQANLAAQVFKDLPVDAILTSNILRARLTAHEFEKISGKKQQNFDILHERKGILIPDKTYQYVETYEELFARLSETEKILTSQKYNRVILIGHSIFLRSLAAYLLLGPTFNEDGLDSIEGILVLENGSISKIIYDHDTNKWQIIFWNNTSHLD